MSSAKNFDLSALIPGFDAFKKMAGQIPGVGKGLGAGAKNPFMPNPGSWIAPTLSVDELEKRITELQTVKLWLENNARLIEATIQALQVQKMTVATLQEMKVNLGDVSVYATAYYILERIRADGFETVMCPGVTSFCAVAARLGRSLTRMEEPLHILPGSTDLDNALPLPGTKVVMKSGKAIYKAAAALERHGLLANAGMVADCGLETEQIYTDLRQLPEKISYFATIVAD